MFTEKEQEKFWQRVKGDNDDECWLWQKELNRKGYGVFYLYQGNYKRDVYYAHRVAYMIANECELGPGEIVMHKCDNPQCCNPMHLQLGTIVDNNADKSSKGRHGRLRLTDDQVRSIYKLHEEGIKSPALATQFETSISYIGQILRGELRKELYASYKESK